jgi:hypothetical protein
LLLVNDEHADVSLSIREGKSSLVVNGEDLTRHTKHVFMETDGTVTRVGIEFAQPDFVFEGQGVVEVVKVAEFNPTGAILEFLQAIDPEQLEKDALASLGMGGDATAEILETLKRYVRGGS